MNDADLERLIDARLRELPTPRAPHSLLPRVLAATSRRPWYTRTWFAWPMPARVASVLVAAAVLVGVVLTVPPAYERLMAAGTQATGSVAQNVVEVTDDASVLVAASRIVWRALIQPIAPYVVALFFVMYLACAAAGTALTYLVFGKAANR
jgi:hypothetical protein